MERLDLAINHDTPHPIEEVFAEYKNEVSLNVLAPGNFQGKIMYLYENEKHIATHDSLTGVPNRNGLQEFLEKNQPPKGLLLVDGNNVKNINDTLGHKRGDEAIIGISNILLKSIRTSDFIARIGGDEFVVLLNYNKQQKTTSSLEKAMASVRGRIASGVQEFLEDNRNSDITDAGINFDIAVGSSIWQKGYDIDEILKEADMDMYAHKEKMKLTEVS